MKKIILATMAILFFSVPLYAEESEENDALYKARERVEEARQQVEYILERDKQRRNQYTGGGDPFLSYYYNKWTGNNDSDYQNAILLYKAALQDYQLELEMAKAEKEYRNIRRKR